MNTVSPSKKRSVQLSPPGGHSVRSPSHGIRGHSPAVDAGVTLQLTRKSNPNGRPPAMPMPAPRTSPGATLTPSAAIMPVTASMSQLDTMASSSYDDRMSTDTPIHGHRMVDEDDEQTRLNGRYDQLRLRAEVSRMEAVAAQLKERELLLKRYYEDVTLPVNDDLGVVLGQIREMASQLDSLPLDNLLDRLETAVEDQALTMFTHIRGSNEELLHGTEFQKNMNAIENRRIRRKEAIERAAARESEQHRATVTMDEARPLLELAAHSTSDAAKSRRTLRSGATASSTGLSASASMGGPTSAAAVSGTEYLGAVMYLMAESIAKTTRCERVRVYMASEDGLGVVHVTSFPCEPTSVLPPQLPRSLLSSVYLHGIAVSGQYAPKESDDRAKAAAAALANAGGGAIGATQRIRATMRTKAAHHASSDSQAGASLQTPPSEKVEAAAGDATAARCTLVFPITIWQGSEKRVAGVIECINKEPGDDEVQVPGEPASSATSNSSCGGRRFTASDEEVVLVASQLLASLMERYPVTAFYVDAGPVLEPITLSGAAASHLPIILTADIPGAAAVGNRSLRAPPSVNIFRGPMSIVHRFSVAESKKELLGGPGQSIAPNSGADLRVLEESLDCLNAMWRRAYDDNVMMHQQCRRLHEQMAEMRRVAERFEEALDTARDLESVQDLHDYLRTVQLSLKSGFAKDVDKAIGGGRILAQRRQSDAHPDEDPLKLGVLDAGQHHHGAASSSRRSSVGRGADASPAVSAIENAQLVVPTPHATPSLLAKPPRVPTAPRRVPAINEIHYDGPEGVREYTVDPEKKRDQQAAIQLLYDAEEHAKLEQARLRLEAIPTYARPTAAATKRSEESPFAVKIAPSIPFAALSTPLSAGRALSAHPSTARSGALSVANAAPTSASLFRLKGPATTARR